MTWSPPTLVMATTLATRDGITELGLLYVVGIKPGTTVWAPGTAALPPGPWSGHGRKPTRLRRDESHQPVSVKALALSLKPSAYRTLTWRKGSNAKLSSRFATVRVTAAHGDTNRDQPRDQEWLLVEWPKGEPEPTKYFLSTLPADISRKELVAAVKVRWRIERDYQELKQEFGLGDFEGRNWRGFHHHATLCIAAYGFLVGERLARGEGTKKTAPSARNLPYPKVTPHGAPVRPQRHVSDSIATLRWEIAVALAKILCNGPCRTRTSTMKSNT